MLYKNRTKMYKQLIESDIESNQSKNNRLGLLVKDHKEERRIIKAKSCLGCS